MGEKTSHALFQFICFTPLFIAQNVRVYKSIGFILHSLSLHVYTQQEKQTNDSLLYV